MATSHVSIPADTLRRIWQILIAQAGACPADEDDFVKCLQRPGCREYSFGGTLGAGGKLLAYGPWYVSYRLRDETPERERISQRTNIALKVLQAQVAAEVMPK